MLITRKAEFSASHRCYNPELSEQQNRDLYGEGRPATGTAIITWSRSRVQGEPDAVTGMVVDLKLLKEILNEHVVDVMDHRHLNHEVPPFDTIVPTVENVAKEIWRRLEPNLRFDRACLQNVRLYETSDLYVDYSEQVSR
jgi:6-pyruvoyltetrahydropterin/6-carboxytetrahydropterin synthase